MKKNVKALVTEVLNDEVILKAKKFRKDKIHTITLSISDFPKKKREEISKGCRIHLPFSLLFKY